MYSVIHDMLKEANEKGDADTIVSIIDMDYEAFLGPGPSPGYWRSHTLYCALHFAVEKGSIPLAGIILNKGADIDSMDQPVLDPPLVNAVRKGDLEMTRYILDCGADIHIGQDWAIKEAVVKRHLEVVRLLFDRGATLPWHGVVWGITTKSNEAMKLWFELNPHMDYEKIVALRIARGSGNREFYSFLRQMGVRDPEEEEEERREVLEEPPK